MQSEMLFLSMFGSLLRILHIANSINREVETLKAAAVAGVKALGVNNCACHAEAKLMDGKA